MNRYQDFYNQQRERKGLSNQQSRRSIFNNVRKERRTRIFDLFRGDIAGYEPEEIRPVSKFTFRDTINKLIREKREKVIHKPRPFVVGTVKHKIHSPPFLHAGCRSKEPKRKLIAPMQKSFAPSNYKFKIPKGLAVNLNTPLAEENSVVSSFALDTVWNKLDNKSTRRKEFVYNNITHHEKERTYMDPSPNDALNIASGKAEQKGAKRELWPEDFDEGPIFGRLNLERRSRSLNSQPEENEKEASDPLQGNISNFVLPNSSFNSNSEKESDRANIQNLELKVDTKDINLPCSTPQLNTSVQNFFKDIQVQFEKSSDASIISTSCGNQDAVKKCLPGHKDAIETATPTSSPVEGSPTVHNSSRIENERTLSDIESLENKQKILNLTFTKSLGLIEEEGNEEVEEETVKLNVEYLNKKHEEEHNMDSSCVLSTLNSSNVNKGNSVSENFHEAGYDTIFFDNAPKSKNTSLVIKYDKNSKEIPLLSKNNVQNNCIDQTINAIQNNGVILQKSPEKINEVITNTSPELIYNPTKLDKDESLENSSKASVKTIPKLIIELNSSKQKDADQSQAQETEQLIDSSNLTFSNSLISSRDQLAEVNHAEIEDNNKNSCDLCNTSSISTSSRIIIENKDINSDAETYNSPILFENHPTEVNHVKPVSEDNENSSEPCDVLSVCISERSVTENKDVNSDAITYSSPILFEDQSSEVSHGKPASEGINKDSSESCNLLLVNTSKRRVTENKNVNSDVEADCDHFQIKDHIQAVATTNSSSSNCSVFLEDQPTEAKHAKPTSGNNNENYNDSRTSSLIDTSNSKILDEKNASLDKIVYSCPPKLIGNIECTVQFITSLDPPEVNITTPLQVEKEKELTAQPSPDSTDAIKIISDETSKPRGSFPNSKIKINIISPRKLEKPVIKVDIEAESAHTGPVQSHNPVSNEPIIDLTNSPTSENRKSTKLELRKSALEYKPSPLFLSNQKHNSFLSRSDENTVIDLVSDDEDDQASYLSTLLKKYGMYSGSPKQSLRNRTPLSSIENSLHLSASRTPQSPLVNKVNSPAKKTPIIIAETIPCLSASRMPGSPLVVKINSPAKKSPVFIVKTVPIVHISPPPADSLEVLQDTPRKTPRRRKALKEIGTEVSEVPSPLRVMNLRTRNISVSPSPNKKTPRAITPRKTPVKYNAAKEIATDAIEDTSHVRVISLRSRKITASPSPKKMTPRRRKKDNQCV